MESTSGAGDLLAQTLSPRELGVPEGPDDVTPGVAHRGAAPHRADRRRRGGRVRRGTPRGRTRLPRPDDPLQAARCWTPRDAPATLVAKFAPADPKLRAHLARGGTARETRFYTEVADRAGLRAPRCYYGAIDEASGRSVLLLEDLTALRPGDNLAGCGLDDATLAVRHLARFHARWWEHADLAGFAWMPVLFDDPAAAQNLYRASWGPFLAAWGHLVPERARAVGEWFASHGATVWEQIAAPPRTLMHGDFRLDNLLFDIEGAPEPLAVVDWQGVKRGKGVADLAYFAMSSLQPHAPAQWERQLVDSYHAALVEARRARLRLRALSSPIIGWPGSGICTRWSSSGRCSTSATRAPKRC